MPAIQPMTATTLGSLMVQVRDITSPSAAGHHLAEATEALDGRPALPPTLVG